MACPFDLYFPITTLRFPDMDEHTFYTREEHTYHTHVTRSTAFGGRGADYLYSQPCAIHHTELNTTHNPPPPQPHITLHSFRPL